MQFDTATYLRRATSRAKSDVANKLISMLLHEISRRVVSLVGGGISDANYASAVVATFGDRCGYCERILEPDRASVEHLDGMNRFRIGLHVQGNVILACKRCNSAKRQDDQMEILRLGPSGWKSFLSHSAENCPVSCKTCAYCKSVWPETEHRVAKLKASILRIQKFRDSYQASTLWADRTREILKDEINLLYRTCQTSANEQIQSISRQLFEELKGDHGQIKP
jgi:hypothetical protein